MFGHREVLRFNANYSIQHYSFVKWFQVLLCITNNSIRDPVGSGSIIYRLHLYLGVKFPNEYPGCDPKHSVDKASVLMELSAWEIPLHCHRSQVRPVLKWLHLKGLIYGSKRTKLCIYAKVNCLKSGLVKQVSSA